MFDPKYIREFIELIPLAFIYIVPGHIFISVFNFVINAKAKDISKKIMECIVTSYIIVSLSKYILSLRYAEVLMDIPEVIICILIGSLISGYCSAKLIKSIKFKRLLRTLGIKRSVESNVMDDFFSLEKAIWVRVYLYNEKLVYFGQIRGYDKKDKYDDGFIVLSNFEVYKYGKSDLYESDFYIKSEDNRFAILKVANINRIEAIYDEDCELIKNLSK